MQHVGDDGGIVPYRDAEGAGAEMPGYRLIKLGEELTLLMADQALAPLRISAREFNVLAAASDRQDRSQQDLSTLIGINPTLMVGIVGRLEELGLVLRRRNPADRRRHTITATTKGRALLRRGYSVLTRTQDDVLGGLDPDERRVLSELIGRALARHWPVTTTSGQEAE